MVITHSKINQNINLEENNPSYSEILLSNFEINIW